jgi:type II secretory pathway pseudopilin PulG
MKKTKSVIFAMLAGLLLTSLMTFSGFASTVQTFTLSASSNQLQYFLPQGTTFNGTISTTGSVRFWVSAPNGFEIVNLGLVDKTATFSFTATQNGTYTLNFENDLSNTIQVTFSFVTNPVIPGISNPAGTSQIYLVVTVIIAVVGSVVIIVIMRYKNKNPPERIQDEAPQNPQLNVDPAA